MKPKYDISSSGPFAEWDATSTVKKHLQTGRLDSIYRFGIKGTCYKVELTAMWYPQQKQPVWGLAVRHIEWETHLSEQEHLPIGHRTDWGDTMATFFAEAGRASSRADDSEDPDMGTLSLDSAAAVAAEDGLGVFVEKLLKLSEIVSSVTNEGGIRL
jgi:transcription elongation factor